MSEYFEFISESDEDRGDNFDPATAAAEHAARTAGDEAKQKLKEEELAAQKAKEAAEKGDDLDEDEDETEEERLEREAEEKAAAEKAEKERKARIPLSRHKEILNAARSREEALQKQILQLQQNRSEEAQSKTIRDMQAAIDELEDKYEEALLEGKKDEAKKLRVEIRDARERVADFKSASSSAAARAEAIATLRYDQALARAEADYPVLNPDDPENFDEDVINEVAALADALAKGGKLPRHEALNKAVKYVLGAPKAKGKEKDADNSREAAARRKAADAAKRQPADTSAAGKDADKGGKGDDQIVDVMKLSQDQFKKLDDETLAKMRGDVL